MTAVSGTPALTITSSTAGVKTAALPAYTVGQKMFVYIGNTSTPGVSITGVLNQAPVGFNLIARRRGASGFAPEMLLAQKTMTAAGETTLTFTQNANLAATVIAWTEDDYNTESPFTLVGSNDANASSVNTLTIPGGVEVPADSKLLLVIRGGTAPETHTVSGMTLHYSAGSQSAISIMKQTLASAGDPGDRVVNWTDNGRAIGMMLAINPEIEVEPDANFSGSPTITPVEDGYQIDGAVTLPAQVSAVAVAIGSTTPSYTQIHAGQDSAGASALAKKSAAFTSTFSLNLEGLDYPLHDVHIAVGAHVLSFTDVLKLSAGGQYTAVDLHGGSLPTDTIFFPGTATGDIDEAYEAVQPADIPIAITDTGGFTVENVVTGRQMFRHRTYDYSEQGWLAVDGLNPGEFGLVYINNEPPVEVDPIPDIQTYTHIPMTPIQVDVDHVRDAEGALLTLEFDVPLPDGLEVVVDTDNPDGPVNIIQGTPASTGSPTTHVITARDDVGDAVTMTAFTISRGKGVAVPAVNIGEDSEAEAVAAIEGAGLTAAVVYQRDSTYGNDVLISVDPPAGEYVPEDSTVVVTISQGTRYTITLAPPLNTNNTNSIVPDTEFQYLFAPGQTPAQLIAAIAAGVVTGVESGTVTSASDGSVTLGVMSNDEGELILFKEQATRLEDIVFWQTVTPI